MKVCIISILILGLLACKTKSTLSTTKSVPILADSILIVTINYQKNDNGLEAKILKYKLVPGKLKEEQVNTNCADNRAFEISFLSVKKQNIHQVSFCNPLVSRTEQFDADGKITTESNSKQNTTEVYRFIWKPSYKYLQVASQMNGSDKTILTQNPITFNPIQK